MDTPLEVVIRNSPPWWAPILAAAAVAALFQFIAVFWAYRLASGHAAKAQKEQAEYNEKLAREGALRTILMSEIPKLESFLARLHTWIDEAWQMGCAHTEWAEVWAARNALLEFALTITKDARLLTDLEQATLDFGEFCQNTMPDFVVHHPEGKRDPKMKIVVSAVYGRFCEVRDIMQAKLDGLIWLG